MTQAKVELFDQNLQVAAGYFKALSHPARLVILNYLAATKVCISGDISNQLPLSRTTVNQHLKELKEVGLIQGTINGSKTNYCLNKTKVKEMKGILNGFVENIELPDDFSCES